MDDPMRIDRVRANDKSPEPFEVKPGDIELRAADHPEAGGRRPLSGDVAWTLHIPLETCVTLHVSIGKKTRDLLFGMMIADCHDSGEPEPGDDR